MSRRIPEVGSDGLRRLECQACGKLLCRFPENARGGPFEYACTRQSCKEIMTVFFNPDSEVLRRLGTAADGV